MIKLPHATLKYEIGRPLIMGVLNVTPDSFSDGGRYNDLDRAIERADAMVRDGADILDIGPESTRPGAEPVSADQQVTRAIPVIREIRAAHPSIAVSVDTRLFDVAKAALEAGADMINDVSGLRHAPEMAKLAADYGAGLVLMHMQGSPETMQNDPRYDDVVADIIMFLEERAESAAEAGMARSHIMLDPGIGFGKTVEHTLTLFRHLDRFVRLGYPILIGASRKRFLARINRDADSPRDRLGGSLACVAHAARVGVEVVRVHDVRESRQMVDTLSAIHGAGAA